MRVTIQLALAALLTGGAADAPRLLNDKLIKGLGGGAEGRRAFGPARLSPDGRHLLYARCRANKPEPEGHQGPWPARLYEPVLRDLATGRDAVLPGPPWTWDDSLAMMLSRRVFSADGGQIVLGVGIDADDNGIYDRRREQMQPMLYEVATGKARRLDVTGSLILPFFDRKGEDLLILKWVKEERKGLLYATPTDKLALKEVHRNGVPMPTCPTADVIPFWLLPAEDNRAAGTRLVLYDLTAGKQTAELPIHKRNTSLDDYTPQWTPDGRYLYYVDYETSGEGARPGRKRVTRVWDRQGNCEAAVLDAAITVGPGPAPASMVIVDDDNTLLHDAAAGRSWQLADTYVRPRYAGRGKLVYVKKADGRWSAHVAEIAMPTTRPAHRP